MWENRAVQARPALTQNISRHGLNRIINLLINKEIFPIHKLTLRSLALSWFGCGYVRRAPGTVGSVGALPFAWAIQTTAHPLALPLASLLVFGLGCWLAGRHLKENPSGADDPQWIVLDEVAGVWLAVSIVGPSWASYAAGFLLFRILDIWKPWPVGWVDRNVKGGVGIMLDDYLAGFIAALLLYGAALVWWI